MASSGQHTFGNKSDSNPQCEFLIKFFDSSAVAFCKTAENK